MQFSRFKRERERLREREKMEMFVHFTVVVVCCGINRIFLALFWLFDLSGWFRNASALPCNGTLWAASTRRLWNYPPSFNYSQPIRTRPESQWQTTRQNQKCTIGLRAYLVLLTVPLLHQRRQHKRKNDIWFSLALFPIKWLLYYWLRSNPFANWTLMMGSWNIKLMCQSIEIIGLAFKCTSLIEWVVSSSNSFSSFIFGLQFDAINCNIETQWFSG